MSAAAGTRAVTVLEREWLPASQAMKRLGRSERSLQRLAAAGHLRWQLRPGTRERHYHAGDVERVKEQGVPASREEPRHGSPATLSLQGETLVTLREVLTAPRRVAVTERLWLSLDEGHELSGLTRSGLLRLCQEGHLIARKDGGWKILRRSLEEFAGEEQR